MKGSINSVFREAKNNYNIIEKTYKLLEFTYEMKINIHPAGQWLLDNMYIIEDEYEEVMSSYKSLKNVKLPVIKTHAGERFIAIYFLAIELINANTGYVDQNIILDTLKGHQKFSYLATEELDLFILMLKVALLKFVARICLNVTNSQMQKINVEKILDRNILNSNSLSIALYQDFKKFKEKMVNVGRIKNTNTSFVEYMAFRLKSLGSSGDNFYNILTDEAEKIGFTVEEAIIKEHNEMAKTTNFIGRAILSYKQLNGINFREIFEKVNKTDEALYSDYTNEFAKCDYKTKTRYRNHVIRIAKRYGYSEVYVAKKAVECSHKYKKHVGFFLIGEDRYLLKKELKKPYALGVLVEGLSKESKPYFYVFSIVTIGLLLSMLATINLYDMNNLWGNIIVAIVAFAFGMEFWEKFMGYVLRKTITPKILPRFDFAKTVDEKNTTYIVMPTVISSIEKLDLMIKKMEVTYLANRSENIYYMLLGDCVSSDTQEIELDKKIVEYAKTQLDELNSRYKGNHKLFNFMYRKRVYSEGENAFMGWERKRGALSHFNKLVLDKLSREEIDKIMYITYDDIIEAKFAITIDEDTSLSLNTAKDLVSIMAHPLNKPILSKDGKIVEKGYGLIQPAVSLDIEAANKSIFSKLFGGFGGLDIYTTAISNVYQDVFNEAVFCGKGIYDIELFEKLLGEEIPENLVLSHDLLEGSFMKAGLASDIEVQDGFPNNYIAYMKRNHRWYRGDMQIVKWLINPNSKINFLSKWKIYDNLRRPMQNVVSIIALIASLFASEKLFFNTVLLVFFSVNFDYFIAMIDTLFFGKTKHMKEVQYIPLIHGMNAVLLSMVFNFINIPYSAYITVNAFAKSIYRMLVSKKHLLEWTTAEMLEKTSKDKLLYYYFNMIPNAVLGAGILIKEMYNYNLNRYSFELGFDMFIGGFFLISPTLAYLLGKSHLFGRKPRLDEDKNEEIIEIAKRTWQFFDSMMTPLNNYLPTDNFQENRRVKIVNRTSSTNIGFSILAIINAQDLAFISKTEAINRLQNLIETVKKLDKWYGHLFNWYNIKTLEPLRPRFVSTVDSGNFIASLYVARQYLSELIVDEKDEAILNNLRQLFKDIREIIHAVDYTKLYDTTRNLFSIGYSQETGKLVDSYYDMLMSENRIMSLLAIATRQITSKHWFSLSRSLVNVDGYKGLMSWTGTAFEYFMPYLFNKSYEHTLIDQSLFTAKYSQRKYARINNTPLGVSESAFAIRDNELNYQYQAFGIPWLGLKRGLNENIVISPYSSIIMLEFAPHVVLKNIKKLKKLNAYSTFGFYEAIDFTKQNIPDNIEYEVVKSYMAHHQGMILTAINNYINHGIIKKRFHRNPDIEATEILLKERERNKSKVSIKKYLTENKPKKKEALKYTTYVSYDHRIDTDDYIIAMLRGKETSAIVTSNGGIYFNYKDKIVNKQKYLEPHNTGNYLYITDKTDNTTFCVTDNKGSKYRQLNKFEFKSDLNFIEYYREDSPLETNTKVFLSTDYSTMVMQVAIYNDSDIRREIVIRTLLEPALTDYMTNIVHPSFNNLQIETNYDKELDVLIANKRLKKENDKEFYAYAKLVGIDLEKDMETERSKVVSHASDAYDNEVSRYPLWPVLSYRSTIILNPYESQTFYYIVGAEESKYEISNAVLNTDVDSLEKQLKFSGELNNVTAKYLQLDNFKALKYNEILKQVIFEKSQFDVSEYWDENLSQSMLWKYSVSGDLPIILVFVNKIENSGIIDEVINFMDYAKNRRISLDIIVLIDEEKIQYGPIYTYVKTRIDRATYTDRTPGNIYVLNVNALSDNEIKVISFLSKKYITSICDLIVEDICEIKNEEETNI